MGRRDVVTFRYPDVTRGKAQLAPDDVLVEQRLLLLTPPMFRIRGFASRFQHNKKPDSINTVRLFTWLGKRDGNITFDDSLDFDISEIESVYEDEGK